MKRSIIIKLKDGTEKELPLSQAAKIKSPNVGMLHLDRKKDGTWGIIWSEGIIDDFTHVDSLEIRRED